MIKHWIINQMLEAFFDTLWAFLLYFHLHYQTETIKSQANNFISSQESNSFINYTKLQSDPVVDFYYFYL